MIFFFFFKQKTAYEMRISDWSSDVCSSDLVKVRAGGQTGHADVADHFTLAHALTHVLAFHEARHVAVGGADGLVVPDHHEVAVAALPAAVLDHAVAGRVGRRALGCGVVDALVRTPEAAERGTGNKSTVGTR